MLKFVRTAPSVGRSPTPTIDKNPPYIHERSPSSVKKEDKPIPSNNNRSEEIVNKTAHHWSDLDEQLYQAVKSNNKQEVIRVINCGGSRDSGNYSTATTTQLSPAKLNPIGDSSLHLCCEIGNLDILSILMNSAALKLNAPDSNKRTPLHRALVSQQTNVGKSLIQSGASLEAQDCTKMTPLHIAAANGDTECVQIMAKNPSILEFKNQEGKTALSVAAIRNQIDVVDVLLTNKADIDTIDNNGHTPLMLAAIGGLKEMVDFLIVRDADPYKTDKTGKNFIQLANESNNSNAVAAHLAKFLKAAPGTDNPPVVLRNKSTTVQGTSGQARVPISNPPINPPKRRNSRLENSPLNLRNMDTFTGNDQRNSQISLASSHSTSSSSIGSSQQPSKPTSQKPATITENPLKSTAPEPSKKDAYTKQLEMKNAELMREQLEMQNKINQLMHEHKRSSDQQVPQETNRKINQLEETVKKLMATIEERDIQLDIERNDLGRPDTYLVPPDTFQTPTASLSNNPSPKVTGSKERGGRKAGAGGITTSQSMGLLKTADHVTTSCSPSPSSSSEVSPENSRSDHPTTAIPPPPPPPPPPPAGGFMNYFNMSPMGAAAVAAAERQRNSQSSDSGYGGASPTSSTRSYSTSRTTPPHNPPPPQQQSHLGTSNTPGTGGFPINEIRSELSAAVQCLKELTVQQTKMQQALDVQSRAITSVSRTVSQLQEALQKCEQINSTPTGINSHPVQSTLPPALPPMMSNSPQGPLNVGNIGNGPLAASHRQTTNNGTKMTNRISVFEKHV